MVTVILQVAGGIAVFVVVVLAAYGLYRWYKNAEATRLARIRARRETERIQRQVEDLQQKMADKKAARAQRRGAGNCANPPQRNLRQLFS